MAYNNTTDIDISVDAYIAGNSAANVVWVMLVNLPALVLCLLSVLALCFSILDLKIKIALINILVSEISFVCALSVRLLGFLARSRMSTNQISCSFSSSGAIVSGVTHFSSITLYSIMVYVILKYGIKKFKYRYMILYIVVTWALALTLSTAPYFPGYVAVNNSLTMIGLCTDNARFVLFRAVTPVLPTLYVICLCVIITFSVLSYHYFKQNTIEGENADIKRAVAKNLVYFFVMAIIAFLTSILPVTTSRFRMILLRRSVLSVTLFNWFFVLLFSLSTVITPIVTITVFKPARRALKETFGKLCRYCRKHVTPECEREDDGGAGATPEEEREDDGITIASDIAV